MTTKPTVHKLRHLGTVIGLQYPLVTASGLASAGPREVVHFEDGGYGQVLTLAKDKCIIMAFGKKPPRLGSGVNRTHRKFMIHLCPDVLGSLIDPVGHHVDGHKNCEHDKVDLEIDIAPLPLSRRETITKTLKTGVALADLLLPLGMGQRELIVGDRKTGKSTFLLQVARNQIRLGNVVVWAAIGKRSSEIKKLYEIAKAEELMDRMVLVASAADDTASIVTLTPFTAMATAEYLRDLGNHVVVIFDDLTTHAKYYREVSLLAKRFPGRDSYPGDIFYLHARLLERAGNFNVASPATPLSITALPVAETYEGELTNFIVSNLISITDGHFFFDSDLMSRGARPPIHVALSVTRVGKQTLTPLEREIGQQLTVFLSEYERTRSLMHFGGELTERAAQVIKRGDALMAFLSQPKEVVYPPAVQLIFTEMVFLDWFGEMDASTVQKARDAFARAYTENRKVAAQFESLAAKNSLFMFSESLERGKDALLSLCRV